MNTFTTDKVGHGYLPTYVELAVALGTHAHVLEVGVANGEGLAMFQALFPRGVIVGVDHNAQAVWPAGSGRIVAKQDDPLLPELLGHQEFDLIVDDASHNNQLTEATWRNLWPLVRPGGFYVIEDWSHAGGLCRDLARDLVDCFREAQPLTPDVERITYRPGMIVLSKVAR